ncbi:MAG: response regulator transcription factor [Myxococcales bacterium]
MQLLVVDDHPEVLDLVSRALAREGHVVRSATSVEAARAGIRERSPDVMILDVALPDGTGIELCRSLREAGQRFPILLLTAHGEVPQRVAGLDAGADDFLPKPFAVAELRARVRALGRRGPIERKPCLNFEDLSLDLGARKALRAGSEIPLTAREWAIVELLAMRAGRLVSRSEILDCLWGEISDNANQSLDVLMARIRRKLGPDVVRTVRGEGYALEHGR